MRIQTLTLLLPFATASAPQHVFSNPPTHAPSPFRIPSIHESAIMARRLFALSSIGTISTVFPHTPALENDFSALENRPLAVSGTPIGLMEYYASCPPHSYNPTILAVSVSTTMKNVAAGSNLTLNLRYHPPANAPPADDMYTYSPANMPRLALVGRLEAVSEEEADTWGVKKCFLRRHEDAELWTPGNDIHYSEWARVVVEEVYWVGGFGDRNYIGWLPVEEWQGVTEKEVEKCRLVGEGEGPVVEEEGWELSE